MERRIVKWCSLALTLSRKRLPSFAACEKTFWFLMRRSILFCCWRNISASPSVSSNNMSDRELSKFCCILSFTGVLKCFGESASFNTASDFSLRIASVWAFSFAALFLAASSTFNFKWEGWILYDVPSKPRTSKNVPLVEWSKSKTIPDVYSLSVLPLYLQLTSLKSTTNSTKSPTLKLLPWSSFSISVLTIKTPPDFSLSLSWLKVPVQLSAKGRTCISEGLSIPSLIISRVRAALPSLSPSLA